MKSVTEIIMWFFLGSLLVLIVTHAEGFATAVTAVGGQVRGAGALLTGAGSSSKSDSSNVAFLKQTQAA